MALEIVISVSPWTVKRPKYFHIIKHLRDEKPETEVFSPHPKVKLFAPLATCLKHSCIRITWVLWKIQIPRTHHKSTQNAWGGAQGYAFIIIIFYLLINFFFQKF